MHPKRCRPFFICCFPILVLAAGCADTGKVEFESILQTTDAAKAGIPPEILSLAEKDPIKLLERALVEYDRRTIRGYTCTLEKQERIKGKMKKRQVVRVKFMEKPFSVAMTWVKNAPQADAFIYVEGRYPDKDGRSRMLVRPKGKLAQWLVGKSVLRLPDCKDAKKNSLRPCTQFGFRNGLKALLKYYRLAKKHGHMKTDVGGAIDIGGRKCVVLVREISVPSVGDEEYPAKISETCLDVETLLPLRVVGYDWNNRMFCTYEFRDVKINPGLTERDFTPEANSIAPPKKK